MGKRGPIPKSNEERILEGNPSKRPLRHEVPKPAPGIPDCPEWLSEVAKEEWQRVVPELVKLGLLTNLDRNILAGYCVSYGLWQQAQESLSSKGTFYVTTKGKLQLKPEVMVAKLTAEMMQGFANELGLSPNGRARLNLSQTGKRETDPMEILLQEIEKER